MKAILGPFASLAAGTITGVLAAIVLGVRDDFYLKCFAAVGAIVGIAPELLPSVFQLVKAYRSGLEQEKTESRKPPSAPPPSQTPVTPEEPAAHQARSAAVRESRNAICSHCGKKTSPVFLHRRVDGSADRRYRDNPMLCNGCLNPYSPERPNQTTTANTKA